jgi:hypothetical protein
MRDWQTLYLKGQVMDCNVSLHHITGPMFDGKKIWNKCLLLQKSPEINFLNSCGN